MPLRAVVAPHSNEIRETVEADRIDAALAIRSVSLLVKDFNAR